MTVPTSDVLTVRVRYFNVLADYAGAKRAEVKVPAGTTVRAFLQHLAEINPAAFRRALVHEGSLRSHLRVFRNEKLVAGEAFDLPLTDGDELMLFPAIAGG